MASFDQGMRGVLDWETEDFLAKEHCPGAAERGRGRGGERRAGLAKTIESEIIPRLVLAKRASSGEAVAPRSAVPAVGTAHVEELARLLLKHDSSVALAYVDTLRMQGVPLGTVYLELLAPAARRLGEWWHEDRCSFFEVTVGLCGLHQLLRGLSPPFTRAPAKGSGHHRLLLAPAPGDQHTFGSMMVGEFFRRSGWDVRYEVAETVDDLARLVRGEWFSLVGLSVGCDTQLKSVAPAIRAARKASCNGGVGVMLGGPLVNARPELVSLMGADATARDGRDAVRQAEGVLKLRASPA